MTPHSVATLRALALAALLCPVLSARADESKEKAREHYLSGQTHYALGEFTEAASEFREAYRLKNEPAILFNVAQAMRQLNNYKQAYFYYSQYLSKRPDAPNRTEVESLMQAMHRKMEADDEADKARATAEVLKPPAPTHPGDHLEETGEGGAQGAAVPGKGGPASKGPAPAPGSGKKVAAAAPKAAQPVAPPVAPPVVRPAPASAAPPAAAAVAAAPSEAMRPAPAEAVRPATDQPGWATGTHIGGAAALGVGAVAGVLAFVFHGAAAADASTLDQHYAAQAVTPQDAALKDSVKSKGQLATVALVGCAALLVTGAVLTFAF